MKNSTLQNSTLQNSTLQKPTLRGSAIRPLIWTCALLALACSDPEPTPAPPEDAEGTLDVAPTSDTPADTTSFDDGAPLEVDSQPDVPQQADTVDAAEPDTSVPDTSQPDIALPDVTEPDTSEPDAAALDTDEQDTDEPDATLVDAAEPDAAEPDAAEPDAGPTPSDVLDSGDTGPCSGDPVNACGGCTELANAPEAPCGPCGLDHYQCDGTEAVVCSGATQNACGGCAELVNAPEAPCGPCDLDHYQCDGTEAVVCSGATQNACGGCAELVNAPEAPCGPCDLDHFQCDGTEAVVCSGATQNACGGCTELANAPEAPCGPCDLDHFQCDGTEAVVCSGATQNACGGCDALSGAPGDPCGPCNLDTLACAAGELLCSGETTCDLPPEPAEIAPPLEPTTDFGEAHSFLFDSEDPVQTGAVALEPAAIAVVHGAVETGSGPLPAVTIAIKDEPGFGQTSSRLDGRFDLAVNGSGERLVVTFEADGYLPVQRTVALIPGQEITLEPVVMVATDPVVTPIVLGSEVENCQMGSGSVVSDAQGERQATVLFKPQTSATVVRPDGTSYALTGGSFRATEYTVGPDGPARMPGSLPPTSAYTYAVELSFDEALSEDGSVHFDKPVVFYVDNFLGFDAGSNVPTGYYDRALTRWVAIPDGLVIDILGAQDGLALIDTNGSGTANSSGQLAAIGIDTVEREEIAARYPAGTSLWRVQLDHFTPIDCNFPGRAEDGAETPNQPGPTGKRNSGDPCYDEGSIIACEPQALGERFPITGTPHALYYWSDRVPGRTDAYTFDMPLTGDSPPGPLKRVTMDVDIAGQHHRYEYSGAASQIGTFTWDGQDGYGRALHSPRTAVIGLSYHYDLVYTGGGASWDSTFGSETLDGFELNSDRTEVSFVQYHQAVLGVPSELGLGTPGWSLDVHHVLVPQTNTLYEGTGTTRNLGLTTVDVIAGDGNQGNTPNYVGLPATEAKVLSALADVAIDAEGAVYFALPNSVPRAIYRVSPDGYLEAYAGFGSSSSDGVQAMDASLANPWSLEFTDDGTMLVADTTRLRAISPDGVITTIGGNGATSGAITDGVLATESRLNPYAVAVGPDGLIYAMGSRRIRTIDSAGIIETFCGPNGSADWVLGAAIPCGHARFDDLVDIDVGNDGIVYVVDDNLKRVAQIEDGIVTNAAEGAPVDLWPVAVAAANDGTVVIADRNGPIYQVGLDDIVRTLTGEGDDDITSGMEAGLLDLHSAAAVTYDSLGDLYIGADNLILRYQRGGARLLGETLVVPSRDGTQLFHFDGGGQHQKTTHAVLGTTLWSFTHTDGLLDTVTDRDGRVTTIERDADGNPTGIIAPKGQRTELSVDGAGNLVGLESPAGDAVTLTWDSGHLLKSLTGAAGDVHQFTYHPDGRLHTDTDPDGVVSTLERVEHENGHTVSKTSAGGRSRTFDMTYHEDGSFTWTLIDESGATTIVETTPEGAQTAVYPSGITATVAYSPDPRWGPAARYASEMTTTTPGGTSRVISVDRSVTWETTSRAPLDIVDLSQSVTVDGQTWTRTADVATRTVTATSPSGRTRSFVGDADGRLLSATLDSAVHPTLWSWDSGLLDAVSRGDRIADVSWDAAERPVSVSNALGETTTWTYDDDDRVLSVTSPVTTTEAVSWSGGRLAGLTRPGGGAHSFGWTPGGRTASWTTPDGATLSESWDTDARLVSRTLPGGRTMSWGYGIPAAPTTITTPEATTTLSYDPSADVFDQVVHVPTSGSPQTISIGYDGGLMETLAYTGAAEATFTYTWDSAFRLDTLAWTSGADSGSQATSWNDDGQRTGFGPFTISRGGPAGAPDQTTDGTVTITQTYDAYGGLETRAHSIGGTEFYRLALVRDTSGRIVERTETVAGAAAVTSYAYDAAGRLLTATDGATSEAYVWSSTDNLESATLDGSSTSGTYDARDRMTSWGSDAWTVDTDGQTTQRGSDTFEHSTGGQLLAATVDGASVSWSYDGFGRRMASDSDEYLYGNPHQAFELTASRRGGVLTRWYWDDAGVLIGFERGGNRYYVGCDQVGTPKIVVDASGVVQTIRESDSFGRRRSETNPAFDLAIGFAGGIEDPDTGLVRLGWRDYDPNTGRWLTADPIGFAGGQANLYLYAHGDPVNRYDPTGTACIDASFYYGLGGGVTFCITDEGTSLCAEAGVGIGGGASVDALGDLARDGYYFGGSVDVSDGPLGVGYKWEINDCGKSKGTPKVKVGPVNLSGGPEYDNTKTGLKGKLAGGPSLESPEWGLKAQAKAYHKVCRTTRW